MRPQRLTASFLLRNLVVAAGIQTILRDVSLTVRPAELHVLMGPNGSGKTTLAQAIAGNPSVTITSGTMRLGRTDLTKKPPDMRARLGIFVAFQQPLAIPGVSVLDFLRVAASARNGERLRPSQIQERALGTLARVGLSSSVLDRELNVGFSGGEQKRFELAQLFFLGARFAVLDEIDSGLDVDGMRRVASEIELQRRAGSGILLITHNPHMLDHLHPHAVHILVSGRLVASGGMELAVKIKNGGYASIFGV